VVFSIPMLKIFLSSLRDKKKRKTTHCTEKAVRRCQRHDVGSLSNNSQEHYGRKKTTFPYPTQCTLSSLSYLTPTWFRLSYGLPPLFTGAFFYGFSSRQRFLFHGWADPTTACLARDRTGSLQQLQPGGGQRPEAIRGLRFTNTLTHSLSLSPSLSASFLPSLSRIDGWQDNLNHLPEV
jgi:hypothetical protein